MNRIVPVVLLLAATSLTACAGSGDAESADPGTRSAAPAPAADTPAPAAQNAPPASPRDTAATTVGADRIYVDYGRPYMRGRTIMGGLVPYGQVWRTGANAATTLVTPRDLRIGQTAVPAGTYTLYTLPGESAWELIINKQTGQWGTEYDQAQDLARVPMQVARTPAPVDQFTIALEPGRDGVVNLALTWENTRATVPMQLVQPGAR